MQTRKHFMKIIFAIISLLFFHQANAQKNYNFEYLTTTLCETFKTTSSYPDSVRIEKTFEKHPYIFSGCKDQKEAEDLYLVLYLKLQMNCPGFDKVSEAGAKNTDDGVTVTEDPPVKVNASACSKIYKQNWFYYMQGEAKINLYINDTSWKSLFPDKTYSLLKLEKLNECEFIISYVESNNFVIANSLQKGYRFRYKIIEEFPDYYNVLSEDVVTKKKQLFKLYLLK